MNITVVSGKGDRVRETSVSLPAEATVLDLKLKYEQISRKSIHRQSFKFGDAKNPTRLDDDGKTLKSYGVTSGTSLSFKDLGPQIGYRTVFLIEYLGPLIFMALYAIRPAIVFGKDAKEQPYNWVALLGERYLTRLARPATDNVSPDSDCLLVLPFPETRVRNDLCA
jgi:very-long-chain enoyl-CoA reductase